MQTQEGDVITRLSEDHTIHNEALRLFPQRNKRVRGWDQSFSLHQKRRLVDNFSVLRSSASISDWLRPFNFLYTLSSSVTVHVLRPAPPEIQFDCGRYFFFSPSIAQMEMEMEIDPSRRHRIGRRATQRCLSPIRRRYWLIFRQLLSATIQVNSNQNINALDSNQSGKSIGHQYHWTRPMRQDAHPEQS